jgi:hypothetical protein
MRFFLKSIDVWQIVETSWAKPEATTTELSVFKIAHDFLTIKPFMLYVKLFYRLNS